MNVECQTSQILEGRVIGSAGPLLIAQLPLATLGSEVEVYRSNGTILKGIITSFRQDCLTIAPLGSLVGVINGGLVRSYGLPYAPVLQSTTTGAIFNSLGILLSQTLPHQCSTERKRIPLHNQPPPPLSRLPIKQILPTGVSAIDGLSPIGYGQRVSLIAPAGSGKSTLLGMITRNAPVDHVVIALIGERGREVKEFADEILGAVGREKSTLIVSTSDEPPIQRLLAAELAMAIAEQHREEGRHVLLIVDSLTRLARSMRDIGLANGEIPIRQGFPPSVLTELPRYLERAGNSAHGTLTAFFSLLQEDHSGNDYLTHEVASLLDGHIILDPALCEQGHFPAINITKSLSRLTTKLLTPTQQIARQKVVAMLSKLERDRDTLLFGGTPDTELQTSLREEPEIRKLLVQSQEEFRTLEYTRESLASIARRA